MKQVFALFSVLFVPIIGAIIVQRYLQSPSKIPTANINKHTFNIQVAKTPEEKEIGLSSKKSLDKNAGMLFPFEKPGYYAFWMKNMKFPIDIIYIRNGRIVKIHENVKPPTNANENPPIYNSSKPADTVLEINAGLSEKYNFKEKDLVKISNL